MTWICVESFQHPRSEISAFSHCLPFISLTLILLSSLPSMFLTVYLFLYIYSVEPLSYLTSIPVLSFRSFASLLSSSYYSPSVLSSTQFLSSCISIHFTLGHISSASKGSNFYLRSLSIPFASLLVLILCFPYSSVFLSVHLFQYSHKSVPLCHLSSISFYPHSLSVILISFFFYRLVSSLNHLSHPLLVVYSPNFSTFI